MPLTLTQRAATFARKIMADNQLVDHVIRVSVARDSGAFSLDVVDELHPSDRAAEHHGVKVVCDPRSYLFLHDTTIDYSESKGGFTFDPPSANRG